MNRGHCIKSDKTRGDRSPQLLYPSLLSIKVNALNIDYDKTNMIKRKLGPKTKVMGGHQGRDF